MAIPKITGAQRDFSAGELDVTMKRADENPLMKAGARQCANLRILNSKAVQNRPGRRALFKASVRTDKVVVAGLTFYFNFTTAAVGTLTIFDSAGTNIFSQTGLGSGIPLATLAVIGSAVYIAAPSIQPQVLTWSGTAWSLAAFAEEVLIGGQKRTPFYRISPPNITMLPSAATGSITITFSAAVLVAGMVNTRMRFCGRQIYITAVSSPTVGTAVVIEPLPPAQQLTLANNVGIFNVGDLVVGATSGAQGIVTVNTLSAGGQQTMTTNLPVPFGRLGDQFTGGTSGATGHLIGGTAGSPGNFGSIVMSLDTSTLFTNGEVITDNTQGGTVTITSITGGGGTASLIVQLLQSSGSVRTFTGSEIVAGPSGSATTSGIALKTPQAVAVWDDEVMNGFRGFPASCFADQGRLGFCNFPAVPTGIAWSGIGTPTDLYPGALPGQPMFELAPARVLFVVPGMEGSEFVFCDTAIYYIPITVSNPLKPGSVAFNQLSQQGCAPNVQPRTAEQTIVYVKAGGTQIGAVQVPGTYNRPNVVDNISELHAHLFNSPVAIAIPSGSTQFEEMYLYVLNGDGTLAVGKYLMKNGLLDAGPDGKPHVGWTRWSGVGTVKWVAALGSDVLFTTSYAGQSVVEILDNTQYLDSALLVNSLPAPFAPPGGKGPLYVFPGPNSTVTLIDQGYRMMGTYSVDANGNIIPQGNAGENLTAAMLTAGQPWTATLEPFVPDAAPGQDVHQRMFKRRVSRLAVYVSQSTGFLMARLFSGPLTRTSPALGTVMNFRRVTAWNQDDDPTLPPPLREEAQRTRPLGRAYDPRVAIIKDTPGPLVIHEIGMEASV